MKPNQFIASILLLALVLNVSLLPAQAQRTGEPIEITFGQPNIWSLEQAHYLLSQMRERSLGIKAAELQNLDPNTAEGARLNLIRQLFELQGEFRQVPQLNNPAAAPSPTPTPLQTPLPFPSPSGSPPNQLSNSVLGELLKDSEFREKLFGDSKLNATTKLDNHIQLQYEIIAKQLTLLRDEVGPDERLVFLELPQSIYASAKKTEGKVAQTYWEVAGYSERTEKRSGRTAAEQAIYDAKRRRENVRANRQIVEDAVRQRDGVEIKSANLGGTSPQIIQNNPRNSLIRAIDIIPRQSSLNVTDIQETVKSSILGGAFSFLFGLGLRTNFQRQRDTFEQYLHQDIYASGFGKGNNVFGWTFGPVPGTKRLSPGIRTTYAVLVVPRDAEALILNARGCYFPRDSYQPRNVFDHEALAEWREKNKRSCFGSEQFVIPIPNGGDARGFWLSAIDFTPVARKGQTIVASINGENLTSQVGVLIDGVPLQQVVELTRKLTDDNLFTDGCETGGTGGICGRYEVIDSNEITIAFKMPSDYVGTPEITVIGPGRAVPLNHIDLVKITAGDQEFLDTRLSNANIPFMFGARPPAFAVTDLQVFTDGGAGSAKALLTGNGLDAGMELFINGNPARITPLSGNRYIVEFPLPNADSITVFAKKTATVDGRNVEQTTVKSFPLLSTQFKITSIAPIAFDSGKNEMYIRVEGSGLDGVVLDKVNGKPPAEGSTTIPVSSRELLIKVTQPEKVIKLTLKNLAGIETSAVLVRP